MTDQPQPTLRQGSTGPAVVTLQNNLNRALVPSPRLNPDGVFGSATLNTVRKFQTQRRIGVDGIVGPVTQCVLRGGPRSAPVIHAVRLIPQPTPSTCWAAATAMLKNTTVNAVIAATPPDMILDGGIHNFSDRADNVSGNQQFAGAHNLRYHPPMSWTVPAFVGLIRQSPAILSMLWSAGTYAAGAGSSGHLVVVYGVDSEENATEQGTLLHIHDPWAPGVGKTHQISYYRLVNETPCFTYGVFTR